MAGGERKSLSGEVLMIRGRNESWHPYLCLLYVCTCVHFYVFSFYFFSLPSTSLLHVGCTIVGKLQYLACKLQRTGYQLEVLDLEMDRWMW